MYYFLHDITQMSTTSDKTDKKISSMGDDGAKIVNNFRDDGATFLQKICDDGMYEFLDKYFKEFNPIG